MKAQNAAIDGARIFARSKQGGFTSEQVYHIADVAEAMLLAQTFTAKEIGELQQLLQHLQKHFKPRDAVQILRETKQLARPEESLTPMLPSSSQPMAARRW